MGGGTAWTCKPPASSMPTTARTFKSLFAIFSITSIFCAAESLDLVCYLQIGKRSCAPLARPQQFLSWPGYVACSVVLASRTPLPALRWFPYRSEEHTSELQS